MRRIVVVVASLLVAAACGTGASEPTSVPATSQPVTTAPQTSVPPTTASPTTTGPTTTVEPTTTTTTITPPSPPYTVAAYGRTPTTALGPSGALGSGCAPGTDALPDGVWFGWITEVAADEIDFDLACLWSGRLEPAASNDAARIRTIAVAEQASLHTAAGAASYDALTPTATTNAPGLPATTPWWLFVNDGEVTELAEYPDPIVWAQVSGGWPQLYPGCCDAGTEAPPSPPDPWPETGWPADGFYAVWWDGAWTTAEDGQPLPAKVSSYDLTLYKWLDCDGHPELCPDYWTGDEVTIDREATPLERTLPLDENVTVVVMPIFADTPIVGRGDAYAEFVADINAEVGDWIYGDVAWDELKELAKDPEFPFGYARFDADPASGHIGYSGPGGNIFSWYGWWLALEIRDGQPVLYLHAGIIAG